MIFAAYVAFIVYYHIEGKEKIPLENIKIIALLLLIPIMMHILMCRSLTLHNIPHSTVDGRNVKMTHRN